MAETKIEWATRTWNVFEGCTKCSPGCDNCYALRDAWRFSHNTNPKISGPLEGVVEKVDGEPRWTGSVEVVYERMDQPLQDKKEQLIFVNSRSDTFHPGFALEDITQVWKTMIKAPWHTFIVVTKRADRMLTFVDWFIGAVYNGDVQAYLKDAAHIGLVPTCCNQEEADRNIPILLETPAALRGVSIEPMLGAVDLNKNLGGTLWIGGQRSCSGTHRHNQPHEDGTPGIHPHHHHDDRCKPGLDWVICGGESGKSVNTARPMHPDWVRSLRDQCVRADVPFFFKQWGEYGPGAIRNDVPLFRMFPDKQTWIHKGDTWVNGGKCIDAEGKILTRGGDFDTAVFPVAVVHKLGKKKAGNLLDGVKWEQMPEVKR